MNLNHPKALTHIVKYKLLIILLVFISAKSFSQISGVVTDSITKESIPYVNIWIENENTGTTSNENGEFEINSIESKKTLVLSALGYVTKRVKIDSKETIIEMNPIVFEIPEVSIYSVKKSKEATIGNYNSSKINTYFGCGMGRKPWIYARFFPYIEDYEQTPYLNIIRFYTRSHINNAMFNVRLYSVNEKGEPGDYIYNENIFGLAKKGKNNTEINISDLKIKFPERGFFISVEWLIIEQNKHEQTYTISGSNKKYQGIFYDPTFGIIPDETDEISWILINGSWNKTWKNDETQGYNINKYSLLAIELKLTN